MFIDRLMLFRYDPQSAAASLAAGNVYWTIACLPVATVGFANTLVAQRFGANRPQEIGPIIWQTFWMMVGCLPLFLMSILIATPLFQWLGHSEELVVQEARYFRILMTVPPALMIEGGLFAFFAGRGRTGPVLAINICACLTNVLLDWLLIFGPGIFPELGVEGAAWATSLSMWLRTTLFAWAVWRVAPGEHFGVKNFRPQRSVLRQLTVQGTSLGLNQVIRSVVMSTFVIQIGRTGEQALQATTVVLSWFQLAAMPLIGLGTATAILVGQATTGNRKTQLRITGSSIQLGLVYTISIGILLTIFPSLVLSLFTDLDKTSSSLIEIFQRLAWFGAAYLILDAMNQVISGSLKGRSKVHIQLTAVLVATGLAILPVLWFENFRSQASWIWGLLLCWSFIQTGIASSHLLLDSEQHENDQAEQKTLSNAA